MNLKNALKPSLLALMFIYGCDSTPKVKTTNVSTTDQSDIMDVSTWDFGDKPYSDNLAEEQNREEFAIVIATFTGVGHDINANKTLSTLAMQYPSLAPLFKARERSRGSVITYGGYSGYDDPKAKKDIKMLRSIPSRQGTPQFGQVMLSKFKSPKGREELHPHNLWTVRREYPTVVPIYTLEVAIWGDFDSGQLPKAKRRSAAESYTSDLRRKGFDAYFYHNDDTSLSSVTVGLFSYRAVDPETGFYSLEVEAMLSRFPNRLVNGEPLLQYFNPQDPSQGSYAQKPCLVEVPVD
jgi:hypothetical protein